MNFHTLYNFVTGPLAWAAFVIFIGGILGRFIYMVQLARKKDPFIFNYTKLKWGLRSIIMWSIPFMPRNGRLNPAMTVVTFAFHICLILTPLFVMGHVLNWKQGFFGFSLPSLPDAWADIMTVVVVAGCVYFAVRRIVQPEAKYVTTLSDFLLLLLVAFPFVTGFLAYHQIFDYKVMIILHIVSGEIWLAAVPFTWLVHMMFAPMIRAYMGSEFGGVRHVKDW